MGAERVISMATTPKKTTAAKKPAAAKKAPAKVATAAAATAAPAAGAAKAKFTQAIEEARAGTKALRGEVTAKAGAYKDQLSARSEDWVAEAKDLAGQAKDRAADLAVDGKAKASDAMSTLGKLVADNAGAIDEKLGTRYGDYARTAARSMQETAAKIEAKDIAELGDDAKEFVRKSPGLAIGIAAVAGFMLSRLFKGSAKE
jgi:ElaB/YqjD/DUF883 family membrane-anchored ribosome-binding protein